MGNRIYWKRGVPEEDIILDYAGFRTYDDAIGYDMSSR